MKDNFLLKRKEKRKKRERKKRENTNLQSLYKAMCTLFRLILPSILHIYDITILAVIYEM